MKFYRGYILTNGKEAIEKIKGRKKFKALEEVEDSPSYAGVLARDVVLVDIDDSEQANILYEIVKDLNINCRVIQTTRGKHFLFKNSEGSGGVSKNQNGVSLACGLTADIKLGSKNSYQILKLDGEEREVLRDTEEVDDLPIFLKPVSKSYDFLNMEAGDGRNNTLFKYILTLQSEGFSKNDCRETLEIINDYILEEPLLKDELDVIMRDESFKKQVFFNKRTFLHDKFARYLISEFNIKRISNQLHVYKGGVYVNDLKLIEKAMIKEIPNLTKARRSEVMAYIDVSIYENEQAEPANKIAFGNGIYDIVEGQFEPFSPNMIITNKINWKYNPGAYNELTDKTLNKLSCHDENIRLLLEEVIGYTFYRRNELGKAFILTGEKSNGKSTYLDMVKTLLGEDNISALDLNELDERFKTAELFGKLANIGDDISDEYISNTGVFKKLVTGDRVNVERKGQDPFDFNNYSKLLFSANSIPRLGRGKDSGAITRRLCIVPFEATFSVDDPDYDPYIKYKLRERSSMEYLINIGLEGLERILRNQRFTENEKTEEALKEYEETNNPVIGFIREFGEENILNETPKDIYRQYQIWCSEEGINNPVKQRTLSTEINKICGFESRQVRVDGKRIYVFSKVE